MGDLANVMTSSKDFDSEVSKICIKLIIYCVAYSIVMEIKDILGGSSGPWFQTDIRKNIYKKLMNLDISFFDANQTGTLLNNITSDVAVLNEVYIAKFLQVFNNIIQALCGLILSFVYSWRVSLIACAAIALSIVIYYIGEYFVGRLWHAFNQSVSNASTKAEQVIMAIKTVKSFDNEMKEADKFEESVNQINKVYNRTSIIIGCKDGSITAISLFMIIGIIYYTTWMIAKKPEWGIKNGDLMILVPSLIFSTIGVTQALQMIDDFNKANVSGERVLDILETPIITDRRVGDDFKSDIKGKIEFKNVVFKYPMTEHYTINDLSFTINPRETVALVGESGCGKSTTLQLLQRFYDIESGQILIDDIDVSKISPYNLLKYISIVPQSPVLFSMSIKDNIRYAKMDSTDSEIANAAKVGNAHDFIMRLPENYKTEVDITSLSGGQKQRICISRAILMNSLILLLDEATAALDTESERLVQESLEKVRQGKTAIVVAHRLATVINADRILVFKEGKVIESGTHSELVAKGGYYAAPNIV
ncbi:ABC transporter family protein [Trichomonas vaginalis G3]|uniref:ABC transporter family protein n=1 Tax=Trichomonas vaginalis (strain ATCC PRA-98 / G3) TaxID=412133 RepID=A2EJ73_TRIV3|nr:ATP-binding cassette sub-family B family [Trichomonas vaginalis G3]EAY07305.1 ABC transporter family protein [Trichomonas vaginalis G3]KAI5550482.1 ATP-binding cassette sub-family B family [Trichomonas vaginalis G3]|eukprot:XP_001319528.1 ABC transporter family protein [Trichomonas vaginalis G3]